MTEDEQPPREPSAPALVEVPNWLCLSLLALFTLAIFSKVLFLKPQEVLSEAGWDLQYFFLHWRYFGFHELGSGNLALWNPHTAAGAPFFGNMQSALLYPLNFLYLLLPLVPAINWTIALHVFLGGVFTFYWTRHRGLHSLTCFLAALMFMFCGPHFLQIKVGHLPNLATLIWAPLLFLAIDKMVDRPALGPALLGMFAVAMAVLAGHPQYVFYLGVAAGIYSLLNLWQAPRRWPTLLGLAAIAFGGVALSAVQLFTALQEGRESIRSLGISYDFAATFSFPPESLLTLLAPWFFSGVGKTPYWGRWYITEVSIFVSVIGLLLAIYGMTHGRPAARRFSITLLLVTLLLALGCYTPLFHFLYSYVPGFNLFRGMDKFIWLAALFLSMLAAIGMDQILRNRKVPTWFIFGVCGLGLVLCLLATLPSQLNWWAGLLQSAARNSFNFLPPSTPQDPAFISATSTQAVVSLLQGAFTLFVGAGLFAFARKRRNLACGAMLLLAIYELISFAGASLGSFRPTPPYSPGVLKLLADHPGDYRIQHFNPNAAMSTGALDIVGDDPSGLLRYKRFQDFIEGLGLDASTVAGGAKSYDLEALRMVRFRYGFSPDETKIWTFADDLPQLSLVDHFIVMTNYHEILPALTNANFDLHHQVILESQPDPDPQPSATNGTVRLLASSTDFLEVQADVAAPCLLFITDAYSSGWRAFGLPGDSGQRYQIMPANYCLRAIPLQAGHHLIRLEYSPLGYRIGKVVSLISLAFFLILTGWSINMPPKRLTDSILPS
jgi:hypothetical protein